MKKTVSLILALVMLMSMSAVAFADETGVGTGSYSVDVTGTYVAGTTGGTDYSVDIAWSAMSFTYNGEKAPVWNAETYSWSESVSAYWDDDEGTITVTNHSPHVISAKPVYAAAAGFEAAEMDFDIAKMYLDTAENGKAAKTGVITVTPSGSLTEAASEGVTIGTITVTIAAGDLSISGDVESQFTTYFTYINDWADDGHDVAAVRAAAQTAYSKYTSSSATEMEKTEAMVAFANEWNKLYASGVAGFSL